MYKNDKISNKQLNMLLITNIFGTGIVILPRLAFEIGGFSSFLLILFAGVFALFSVFIIKALINLFPDKSFYEYTSIIMGKPISLILTAGFILRLVIHTVLTIKIFLEIAHHVMLPNTPIWIVAGLIILVSGYGASKGYEARAAMAEIFMPLVLLPILIIYLLAIPSIDLNHLGDFILFNDRFNVHMFFLLYAFTGIELLLLVRPYVSKKINVVPSVVILTVVMIFVTIITQLRFGSYIETLRWPVIEMIDATELPNAFLQRHAVLMMSFFIISVFSIVNACVFFSSLMMKSVLKRGSHTTYVIIVCAICFLLFLIEMDVYSLLQTSFYTFGIAYMFVIPIVLLFFSKVSKRILILIPLIFLLSCGTELSELDFVISMSVEQGSLIVKTENEVKRANANSLEEAINKINEDSTKNLYFGFTQTVVVDKITDEIMSELLDIRDLSSQVFLLTREQMPSLPAKDEVPKKFKNNTLETFSKIGYARRGSRSEHDEGTQRKKQMG